MPFTFTVTSLRSSIKSFMESVSMVLSLSPLLHHHLRAQKLPTSKSLSVIPSLLPLESKSLRVLKHTRCSATKELSLRFRLSEQPPQNPTLLLRIRPLLGEITKIQLPLTLISLFLSSSPCFASEIEQASDKLSLEAVLVSIDEFLNRYPFFVAGCTFIWLVVIPLSNYYLSKCKLIYAIDAFKKLRSDVNTQLLDIRDEKMLATMNSPNLQIFNKNVAHVQYSEDDEDGFIKKMLDKFEDPANTVICIMDNSDGNSMKVAELLFKIGFKEAYAIKGGAIGKKGWLSIQQTLLPSSVHIKPKKKKVKASEKLGVNGGLLVDPEDASSANASPILDLDKPEESTSQSKTVFGSLSPYPNYPDLKPPSSPTPSKPRI